MSTIHDVFGVGFPKVSAYKGEVPCLHPDLIIGLELETENLNAGMVDYAVIAKKHNIRMEHDGSLRGPASEFVTNPMHSTKALAAVGNFFKEAKLTTDNYSDRCSVHVHVNCTDMEVEQVAALTLIYTTVEEILFKFVGANRDSNIYCIPWSHCRSHFDLVQRFLYSSGDALRNWSKYTALNLLPLKTYGTVEFRQMPGTCDMDKLTKWVNMIGAMVHMARTVALNDLITEIKSLNTNSQYEAFFVRALGGQLPYDLTYAQELEAGVINAKFGLFSAGKKKPKEADMNEILQEALGRQGQVFHNAEDAVRFFRPRPYDVVEVVNEAVPAGAVHDEIRGRRAEMAREEGRLNAIWNAARLEDMEAVLDNDEREVE